MTSEQQCYRCNQPATQHLEHHIEEMGTFEWELCDACASRHDAEAFAEEADKWADDHFRIQDVLACYGPAR